MYGREYLEWREVEAALAVVRAALPTDQQVRERVLREIGASEQESEWRRSLMREMQNTSLSSLCGAQMNQQTPLLDMGNPVASWWWK